MKSLRTAVTLADAAGLDKSEIFDLEGAYTLALSTIEQDDSRQGVFHPSGVGACRRKQVYCYTRAPFIPTTDPDSREIFDMGHAVHELLGRKLADVARVLKPKNIGYNIRCEVPFDPSWDQLFSDLGVAGTADVLGEVWADLWRQRFIVEAKSINQDNFEKLNGPKIDHLMQAHLYAYRFDCPVIYNWYYCKNNSKRRVYASAFDWSVFNAAVEYFEKLLYHVRRGTLPDRDEDYYLCPRCEYREICKPTALTVLRRKGSNQALSDARSRGRLS